MYLARAPLILQILCKVSAPDPEWTVVYAVCIAVQLLQIAPPFPGQECGDIWARTVETILNDYSAGDCGNSYYCGQLCTYVGSKLYMWSRSIQATINGRTIGRCDIVHTNQIPFWQ